MPAEDSGGFVLRIEADELDDEERQAIIRTVRQELHHNDVEATPVAATDASAPGAKGGPIMEAALHVMWAAPAEAAFALALEGLAGRLRKKARLVVEGPSGERIDLSVTPKEELIRRLPLFRGKRGGPS